MVASWDSDWNQDHVVVSQVLIESFSKDVGQLFSIFLLFRITFDQGVIVVVGKKTNSVAMGRSVPVLAVVCQQQSVQKIV